MDVGENLLSRRFILGVNAVEGSGEGDGFADVVQAADPGYCAFDPHAEAGVGDGAVAAEVEVPLEGSEGQLVPFDAGLEAVAGFCRLWAARIHRIRRAVKF